jgi:hypothetical protein
VPGVSNAPLLQGVDLSGFGLRWDGNEAMRGRGLDVWLTDRSRAQGGWSGGLDPVGLLHDRRSPLLCLTHPNNWVSGPSLWADRVRARSDRPPAAAAPAARLRRPRP